jgi:hypothetical protein
MPKRRHDEEQIMAALKQSKCGEKKGETSRMRIPRGRLEGE